jgi:site-specific recombinase XerD
MRPHRRTVAASLLSLHQRSVAASPQVGGIVPSARHKTALTAEQQAAAVWQPWPGHDDLVFPTQIGTPTDPRNALRAFAAIAERAEHTGVTLHTLRHSTASALIAAGEHIKVVQEMLGHSSDAITADIYSHVNVQQQRAVERLGEAFLW